MEGKMATAKAVLSTVGSVAATAMVARSIINEFLPCEVHDYLFSPLRAFLSRRFSPDVTVVISEFDGLESNHIFEAAQLYLGSLSRDPLSSSNRLRASKPESEGPIRVTVDQEEEVVDLFLGVRFRWVLHCHRVEAKGFYNPHDMDSTLRSEARSFSLSFPKKASLGKETAINKYLPHVLDKAAVLKRESKTIKLHTVDSKNIMYGLPGGPWTSVSLSHPATFDTLAMDPEAKRAIVDDLERFVGRKEYYRRVGRAWKRGYLLYGPPGTGKSSLIAAMANYLSFDIYDLELGGLGTDSDLRKLLVGTANRSVLVVEDIDCSVDFKDRGSPEDEQPSSEAVGRRRRRQQQVTLSGLLNFIDGLWSSCGDERIIVFTTNHKEKLDPALLRPGRMDMHIHMSYCTPSGFKVLARNYLGVTRHELFGEIERVIDEARATPAEVAEQLLKHENVNPALEGLIGFLRKKKKMVDGDESAKTGESEGETSTSTGRNLEEQRREHAVDEG